MQYTLVFSPLNACLMPSIEHGFCEVGAERTAGLPHACPHSAPCDKAPQCRRGQRHFSLRGQLMDGAAGDRPMRLASVVTGAAGLSWTLLCPPHFEAAGPSIYHA